MQKVALRLIGVSVFFTFIFIAIGIGLTRWQQTHNENPSPINIADPSPDQIASIAVQFNTNGIGTQVIDGTALTFKFAPYPPKANTPSSLTLIPLNTRTNTLTIISPTLLLSPNTAGTALEQSIVHQADGSYRANDLIFSQAGSWRLRINFSMNGQSGYGVLMLVEAR